MLPKSDSQIKRTGVFECVLRNRSMMTPPSVYFRLPSNSPTAGRFRAARTVPALRAVRVSPLSHLYIQKLSVSNTSSVLAGHRLVRVRSTDSRPPVFASPSVFHTETNIIGKHTLWLVTDSNKIANTVNYPPTEFGEVKEFIYFILFYFFIASTRIGPTAGHLLCQGGFTHLLWLGVQPLDFQSILYHWPLVHQAYMSAEVRSSSSWPSSRKKW